MKIKSSKAFITFLLFPFCFTSHLETFLIETRKSESINSLFQTLTPCQLTLITNHPSSIQFLSQKTPTIQIFNLPAQLREHQFSHLYSKKYEKSTYSVFFGQQYNVKFNVPICKVNFFIYRTKHGSFVENIESWPEVVLKLWDLRMSILFHNHLSSRSVYCTSKTYYVFLGEKGKNGIHMFRKNPQAMLYFSRFWMLTFLPLDTEFMKPKTEISVWFSSLVCDDKTYSPCPPVEYLDKWTCELLREDAFSNNYVCRPMK